MQDDQETTEEDLRAENARLRTELEQLRRAGQATVAVGSEDTYRFFLDTTSDGVFQWSLSEPLDTTLPVDEQVRLLYEGLTLRGCNRAFAEQYGLPPSVISEGFRLYDVHAADSPTNNEMMRRYVLNGYRSDGELTEETNLNGERRWFLNRIVSRVENGFVYDGWGIQTDITELRAAEEAIFAEQERAARQKAEELAKASEALRRAADRLTTARSAEEILSIFLQETIAITGASDGAVLRRIAGTEFEIVALMDNCRFVSQEEAQAVAFVRSFREVSRRDEAGYFARILQGKTITCRMEELAAWFPEAAAYFQSRSYPTAWDIPFTVNGEVAGYLGLAFHNEGEPGPVVAETITALANQIAVALELTRLSEADKRAAISIEQEKATRERAEELARVNMVLQNCLERLSASDGPEAFLSHILTEIAHLIEASSLFLFRYDPAANSLSLHLSYLNGVLRNGPCGDEFAIFSAPFPADITPAFVIMCRERRFFTPSNTPIPAEEFAWPGVMEELSRSKPSDVAHLALLVGETPVGSLGFEFRGGKRLREEDQPLVMALAQQAAIALRLSDLAEQERLTTVAREREKAAVEQAAELVKANDALRKAIRGLARLEYLDQFLAEMLRAAIEISGAHSGAVDLIEGDTIRHAVLFSRGGPLNRQEQTEQQLLHTFFSKELRQMADRIMQSEEEWIVPNDHPMHPPSFQKFHQEQGNHTISLIPLRIGDRLLGWLGLGFPQARSANARQYALLSMLADQMTAAVEMLRLSEAEKRAAITREQEKATQERAEELAKANMALQSSVAQIASVPDVRSALDIVLKAIGEQAGAVDVALFGYDPVAETVQMQVFIEHAERVEIQSDSRLEIWRRPYAVGEFAEGWHKIISQEEGYFVEQVTVEEPGFAEGVGAWHVEMGHKSVSSFPLMRGAEPVGFIGLTFEETFSLTPEKIELVRALAQQATLAMELVRLAEEAKQTAIVKEQERAAQERAEALEQVNATLRQSVAKLSQQTDIRAFLAETLGEIVRQMNAANGLILILDAETRMAQLHLFHDGKTARWGMSGAELPLFANAFSAGITPAFDIMCREHRPICASRTPLPIPIEQFALPGAMEFLKRIGASDSAIITLRAGERVMGTLHLQFVGGTVLREEDEPLFVAMSQQAAIAMRLTELAEASRQAAVIEERNRLAQEIHDTLAQSFNSIKFLLEATESGSLLPVRQNEVIARARELASEGAREARRSVWALRPAGLERGDLLSALNAVVRQRSVETTLRIELRVEGEPFALNPEVEDNLLRVVQEALANVTQHARANRVEITLRCSAPQLTLRIRDDGIGFVPTHPKLGTGFGLGGMHERMTRLGGTLNITSTPGKGTEIHATVPDAQ